MSSPSSKKEACELMAQENNIPRKHGGVPQTSQAFEMDIYRLQRAQIRLLYGRKASEEANYGWAVDADEDWTTIQTKVYVDPPIILTFGFQSSIDDY